MKFDNTVLITHKGCLDGSGCAIAFLLGGGKKENIYFTPPVHEATDQMLSSILEKDNNDIILADCSISHQLAKKIDIAYENLNITLLDHHKTAIPLKEFSWCTINKENTECGSMMMYNFVKDNVKYENLKLPDVDMSYSYYIELFSLIDDHDRWQKSYPESDDLDLLHNLLGQKSFISRFYKNPFPDFSNEEKFVIELEKQKMQEEIHDKKKSVQSSIVNKMINGKKYRLGFVSGVRFTSTTGNALCEDPLLNLDAVVLVSGGSISMRTKKGSGIDLSSIAKLNDGGGHSEAAGFPLKSLLKKDLIDFVADNMKLQ